VTDKTGWWRSAAIYQVYIRSFADGNGDGVGDLAGVRARLDHLADLGIDAIWFTPWYPSPMDDGGYDVADFRDIEPLFGTLAEAEELIAEAHARNIRVLIEPDAPENFHAVHDQAHSRRNIDRPAQERPVRSRTGQLHSLAGGAGIQRGLDA